VGGPRRRQKNLKREPGLREYQKLPPYNVALPTDGQPLTCGHSALTSLPALYIHSGAHFLCKPDPSHLKGPWAPSPTPAQGTGPSPLPRSLLSQGPHSHSVASPAGEGHLSKGSQHHRIPKSHKSPQRLCQEAQLSCQHGCCLYPRRQLQSQGVLMLGDQSVRDYLGKVTLARSQLISPV
jgi:hypothetical protein